MATITEQDNSEQLDSGMGSSDARSPEVKSLLPDDDEDDEEVRSIRAPVRSLFLSFSRSRGVLLHNRPGPGSSWFSPTHDPEFGEFAGEKSQRDGVRLALQPRGFVPRTKRVARRRPSVFILLLGCGPISMNGKVD